MRVPLQFPSSEAVLSFIAQMQEISEALLSWYLAPLLFPASPTRCPPLPQRSPSRGAGFALSHFALMLESELCMNVLAVAPPCRSGRQCPGPPPGASPGRIPAV